MADNTQLNVGTGGDVIATDDLVGIKHQLVKVEFGADGVATMVNDAAAARLPVKVGEELPAGTQNIGDVDIASLPNEGQQLMANSISVAVASDQSTLPVSIAATLQVDVTDEAARDLGKVDIALLDQYTPIDVDSGAGTVNALPVTWRKNSALGVEFGTSADPVRTDPTGTTIQPVSGTVSVTEPVSVDDNAGSLTVDAPLATPVHVRISDGVDANLVTAAGELNVLASAQPGVDIGDVTVNNAGAGAAVNIQDGGNSLTVDGAVTANQGASTTTGWEVQGDIAHDSPTPTNPVFVGVQAKAHGSDPTAVADADVTKLYANRDGILFTMGGHPNMKTAEYNTTAAGTDDNILPAIAAGTIYVVTAIEVTVDKATTVDVGYRIGFGATTLTAEGASQADAVDKIVSSHPGLAAGSGVVKGNGGGIIGIGGDGEELRITNEVPTTGKLRVVVTYFTIES